MSDKEKKPKKKLVGGQAVIGGVMMRGRKRCFMATRSPYDDRIELSELPLPNFFRWRIFKWPFIRGMSMVLDSAVLGTKALTASADFAEREEEKKKAAEEGRSVEGIDEKPGLISGKRAALLLLPGLVFGVALFVLGPLWAARGLKSLWPVLEPEGGIWFNLVEGGIRVILFLLYLALIRRMKDVLDLFRYHGAEHKTIAAFEADEALTVENVIPKSRLHPRCGTGFLVFMLIALVLVHSVVFAIGALQGINFLWAALIRIGLIPVVAGVAYEWIRLAGRHPKSKLARFFVAPGLATQLLTTAEPDEGHLECAITAFKAVLEAEGAYEDPADSKRPIAA
ncbi:DUF1385 domain-containing protein [bacterium]|nr:DUF1385 domain-containing protein [bacterium]